MQKKLFYGFLGFFLFTFIFWPGMMTPDSDTQYSQVLSGHFSNHHPVAMGLLWSFFNNLIKGPGLMFAFHSALLWISVTLLARSFNRAGYRYGWVFFCLPFWPVVFAYTQLIWKDVSFSHAYLLVTALLVSSMIEKKKLSLRALGVSLVCLAYGTSVKYQAFYLLPFYAWWIAERLDLTGLKKWGFSLVCAGGVLSFHQAIDTVFVPPARQSHAWQMARLYDLAGISVRQNKPLFPGYILNHPSFSMDVILKDYSPQNIDSLIYGQNKPLTTTHNEKDLSELWHVWEKAVMHYPLSYLQHRFAVWRKLLNRRPDNYLFCINAHGEQLRFASARTFGLLYIALFNSILTRFYVSFLFLIFCFLWLPKAAKKYTTIDSKIFFYLPLIGLFQVGLYFFLSMASDLRYLYLASMLAFLHLPFLCQVLSDQKATKQKGCEQ